MLFSVLQMTENVLTLISSLRITLHTAKLASRMESRQAPGTLSITSTLPLLVLSVAPNSDSWLSSGPPLDHRGCNWF